MVVNRLVDRLVDNQVICFLMNTLRSENFQAHINRLEMIKKFMEYENYTRIIINL